MSDDSVEFERAVEAVRALPERPDDRTALRLYALYKQASAGDLQGARPGFFDFVATAKYEAWEKLKGTRRDDARREYVELVRKLGGQV